MSTPVIEVRAWGTRVGALAADPRLQAYVFEYAPAWARGGIELAPLTMPTSRPDRRFVFPDLAPSFLRLPGLVADALPDDFGNALIDAWMARRGVSAADVTALDRLSYMGKRGMGALEFRPASGSHTESTKPLDMKNLVEAARLALRGDFAGDTHAQTALANMIRVGTSAGGARAKAVIAWNAANEEIRSGQFDAAPGFEHWLLKFDGVGADLELGTSKDYGRIEYAYYKMATSAGIDMMPSRLLHENGRSHFMTKRFDRDGNVRHHVQSLCALAHLDYKQRATNSYEQLFLAINRLGLDDEARRQAYLRMVFNVMARNCDDHTKNFGFVLPERGPWALAPAFDVTHAHNPKGEWTAQHLMSVNGRFDDVRREDLEVVADRFGVVDAKGAVSSVRDAIERWPALAEEAGVAPDERQRVAADFRLL
ncbi:MAG TPA: type II toxin-antitoxin system HipA family toxin [Gammaproteobacteria bacterium]|nr:type II toxin-antitoxin system HipA family toxin [Gammaproteobacteria bacterium]